MFLVPITRHTSDATRTFDRLFGGTVDRLFAEAAADQRARLPALDVCESDRTYTVKLDMPGVSKDDVQISIQGNLVKVQANTGKESEKKEGERIVYRERSVSSFARSFTLPAEVDEAASSAKLDNGVLTLTLQKRPESQRRRITVN